MFSVFVCIYIHTHALTLCGQLYALYLCRCCHLFLAELSRMFFCNRLIELSKNILLKWLDTCALVEKKGLERVEEAMKHISVCSVSVAEMYFQDKFCIMKSHMSGNYCYCFLTVFYV